jgi:DNA polymerase-3 subunit epsilon
MIKIDPSGAVSNFEAMVNPMMHLPTEIEEITGITDEQVQRMPPFSQFAQQVAEFMEGCDLCGYNLRRFDLPLLSNEMYRCGIFNSPDDDCKIIDVQSIFHQRNGRTLSDAVRQYLNKDHSSRHTAMGDAMATMQVLEKQLHIHSDLPRSINDLHDLCGYGKSLADHAGHFYYNDDDQLCFNIGKHKDQPVVYNDRYVQWFLQESFPFQSKKILAEYTDNDWFLNQYFQSQIEF